MRGKESMNTQKLRGSAKMDLQIRNTQWSVTEWQNWCDKHNMSLILEDGKVVGYESKPERWHV